MFGSKRARVFQIDRDEWPEGVSDGQSIPCWRCGCEIAFDWVVDDHFWKSVMPQGDDDKVVCLTCFARMALKDGMGREQVAERILRVQFCIPGLTVEMIPTVGFMYDQELAGCMDDDCDDGGVIR